MKKSLKKIRIESGLSQFELALASGVPRYVIQLAEIAVREPKLVHQKSLADTLGVPISELFSETDEVNHESNS